MTDSDIVLGCLPMIKRIVGKFRFKLRFWHDDTDLIQIGMMAVARCITSYRIDNERGVPFDGYAAICVKRDMLAELRKAKGSRRGDTLLCRESKDGTAWEFDSGIDNPEQELLKIEEVARLHKAIASLRPNQRKVLEVTFLADEKRTSEIANKESLSVSSMHRTEGLILKKLKRHMKAYHGGEAIVAQPVIVKQISKLKRCTVCSTAKPRNIETFQANTRSADGLQTACRSCETKRSIRRARAKRVSLAA